MAIGGVYSIGLSTGAPAAGAPYAEIRATTSAIVEIAITLKSATPSAIGLIRTATLGTSLAANRFGGQPEDPSKTPAAGFVANGWTAAPTISATPLFLRQIEVPGIVGTTIIWTWSAESPLLVGATATEALVIWNFGVGAGSDLSLTVRWGEAFYTSTPRFSSGVQIPQNEF